MQRCQPDKGIIGAHNLYDTVSIYTIFQGTLLSVYICRKIIEILDLF